MRKSWGACSVHALPGDGDSETSGVLGSTAGGAMVEAIASPALGDEAGADVPAGLEELAAVAALAGEGDGELAVRGVGADAAHAAPDATTASATTESALLMAGFLSHARSRHGAAFALPDAATGPACWRKFRNASVALSALTGASQTGTRTKR